jgi:hypothetical protein
MKKTVTDIRREQVRNVFTPAHLRAAVAKQRPGPLRHYGGHRIGV